MREPYYPTRSMRAHTRCCITPIPQLANPRTPWHGPQPRTEQKAPKAPRQPFMDTTWPSRPWAFPRPDRQPGLLPSRVENGIRSLRLRRVRIIGPVRINNDAWLIGLAFSRFYFTSYYRLYYLLYIFFKHHLTCTFFLLSPSLHIHIHIHICSWFCFVLFECWSMVCIPCRCNLFSWPVDMSILVIYVRTKFRKHWCWRCGTIDIFFSPCLLFTCYKQSSWNMIDHVQSVSDGRLNLGLEYSIIK